MQRSRIGAHEPEVKVVPMISTVAVQAVAAARRDLAVRAGVEPDAIIVCQIKEMEWPDESLGCPEPGRTYTPRPTKGYVIVLDAVSREYEYHADAGGRVTYCGKRYRG